MNLRTSIWKLIGVPVQLANQDFLVEMEMTMEMEDGYQSRKK